MGDWNSCKDNPWDHPEFTTSGGADVVLRVDYQPGQHDTCASIFDPGGNGTNATIFINEEATIGGELVDCTSSGGVRDSMAHELGHYLGLDDISCGGIMDPATVGLNGQLDTGRSIEADECALVDSINTNPQEEFEEDCDGDQGCGNQGGGSPILIDLGSDRFRLTSLQEGVHFDIDGDGELERVSWTRAGDLDAFLCRDRNGNGRIDSGRELFGDATLSLLVEGSVAQHGYQALREYDSLTLGGNRDGLFDSRDAFFGGLCAWIDIDHDGVSTPSEIHGLAELGVESIALRFLETRHTDEFGNLFRFISRAQVVIDELHATVATTDVFFVVSE